MKNKRIGIDGRLWNESGVGRYIRNLVGGIENKNYDSEFVIFLTPDTYEKIEFKNPNFRKAKSLSKWHSVSEQWIFKKELEKERLDLIHFPYFSYPIFYNRPFVITIHDLIIDHYPTGNASSLPLPIYKIKHFGYRKIIKHAINNSKKIIVPSNATKEEIEKHYSPKKGKIEVVYEGFDSLISNSKSQEKLLSDNYILYVGNAYPHKNLKVLFEAFKRVRETIKVDLICIGRDDSFYKELGKMNIEGIKILHDIDDKMLFEYYTNARLFVMPSLMEGFGLPALEAMSLSCPVVSSQTSALKEICGNAALYFDPDNVGDLVSALKKALNDKKLLEDLSKKGNIQASKYSWDRCVNETLKVYESCNSV